MEPRRNRTAREGSPLRAALARKGEAVVWAANLAHGGAPATDPASTRRSLVVHHYSKGCLPFTPMTSAVEGERLHVRLPADIATGGVEWPRRGRRPALSGEGQIKDAFAELVPCRIVSF